MQTCSGSMPRQQARNRFGPPLDPGVLNPLDDPTTCIRTVRLCVTTTRFANALPRCTNHCLGAGHSPFTIHHLVQGGARDRDPDAPDHFPRCLPRYQSRRGGRLTVLLRAPASCPHISRWPTRGTTTTSSPCPARAMSSSAPRARPHRTARRASTAIGPRPRQRPACPTAPAPPFWGTAWLLSP